MLTWILVIVAVVVGAVLMGKRPKAAAPQPQPKPADLAPPPPVDPVVPPKPVEPPPPPPVDPVVPKPVDPVTPPPPPPVEPLPPAKPVVNYAIWAGLTRAQAEARKLDTQVPGWSWEDFAASGFMEGLAVTGNPNNPGDRGSAERKDSAFRWPVSGESVIRDVEGHANSTHTRWIPVPKGWRGVMKIGAYGERGFDPQYGGRIEMFRFTVRDQAGEALASERGGLIPFEINVDRDLGNSTAEMAIEGGGLGYMQLNVYPR